MPLCAWIASAPACFACPSASILGIIAKQPCSDRAADQPGVFFYSLKCSGFSKTCLALSLSGAGVFTPTPTPTPGMAVELDSLLGKPAAFVIGAFGVFAQRVLSQATLVGMTMNGILRPDPLRAYRSVS